MYFIIFILLWVVGECVINCDIGLIVLDFNE